MSLDEAQEDGEVGEHGEGERDGSSGDDERRIWPRPDDLAALAVLDVPAEREGGGGGQRVHLARQLEERTHQCSVKPGKLKRGASGHSSCARREEARRRTSSRRSTSARFLSASVRYARRRGCACACTTSSETCMAQRVSESQRSGRRFRRLVLDHDARNLGAAAPHVPK